MAMPVSWYDDEHTIIVVTIHSDSTWNEYYEAVEQIVSEAAQVDHRVDIIFHDNVGMPKGNPFPHLSWGSKKIISQPNTGHTVIAGSQGKTNSFVYIIMTSLGKVFMRSVLPMDESRRLLFMPDFESALTFIQDERKLYGIVEEQN